MKKLLGLTLVIASSLSHASTLLERALNCELQDSELKNLIQTIAVQQPELENPTAELATPSINLYELKTPITAFGYTSTTVAVTPARIMLAIPAINTKDVVKKLKLTEDEYSPASRIVRPTVSVVSFKLSHASLQGKTLVGCEYANPAAATWIQSGSF
ncbi:MAG: hypothetical protein QM709_09825 [Spongiibacteraceae bacterium]